MHSLSSKSQRIHPRSVNRACKSRHSPDHRRAWRGVSRPNWCQSVSTSQFLKLKMSDQAFPATSTRNQTSIKDNWGCMFCIWQSHRLKKYRIYQNQYQSLWDKVKTDEMVSPLRSDQLVCRKENLQLLHVMGDGPSITFERGDLSP